MRKKRPFIDNLNHRMDIITHMIFNLYVSAIKIYSYNIMHDLNYDLELIYYIKMIFHNYGILMIYHLVNLTYNFYISNQVLRLSLYIVNFLTILKIHQCLFILLELLFLVLSLK